MKKITTLVFVALGIFALGSLTSCKDDSEDNYNDLRSELLNQNSTLRDLLEAQKADLQGQIDVLQDQLSAIKSCTCDPNDIRIINENIQNIQNNLTQIIENGANQSDIDALKALIKDLEEKINNISSGSGCSCDLTEINEALKQIKTALDGKADKTELEKLKNELNEKLVQLDARVAALEAAKQTIENDIQKIKETLTVIQETLEGRITNLEQTILVIQNNITSIKEDCKAANELLQKQIDAINERLDNLGSVGIYDDTALRNIIADLQKQIDILKNQGSNEYDDTAIKNTLADLQAQIDALKGQGGSSYDDTAVRNLITDLQAQIDALKSQIGNDYDDTEIRNLISALRDEIENLRTTVNNLQKTVINLQTTVTNLNTTVTDLNNTITNLNKTVNNLQQTVTDLETKVENTFVTVEADIAAVDARVTVLEEWINAMKALYGDNLEALNNPGGSCSCDIEALRTEIQTCKTEAIEVSKAYTDEAVRNLVSTATLETKLGEITAAYQAADQALQEQITALDTRVGDLEDRVSTLEEEVDKLTGLYEDIVNRLNAQISSIVVQSVTTPLLLDINLALPFNFQSNVICGYYGETPEANVYFPTYSNSYELSDPSEKLTEEEATSVVGFGKLPKSSTITSTGGKLYLTINPSNVDCTGANLKLVNSQNQEAGYIIKDVKKSDKLLSFVSRSADNGFYEADLELVDPEKAAFPTAPLKEAAKEVYNLVKTHTGVRDMASAVVKAAYQSVSLPAYAVQAPYTYTDENGAEVTAYVHSNYNMTATAVHPLTYNFTGKLGDYTSQIPHKLLRQIPYISEKLIGSGAWQKIKAKLYFEFDKVDYTAEVNVSVEDIKFVEGQNYITITVTYQRPVQNGSSTGATVTYTEETIDVMIQSSDVDNMAQVINDAIQNDMIQKINDTFNNVRIDIVDAVNEALKNTEDTMNKQAQDIIDIIEGLAQKSDTYIDKVNKLIDKINNQLNKVYARLDNIDSYLLPVMFYGDANGVLHHMSVAESTAGYVTPGYMVLYPTSYTAEILNPAYKKVVKVTKAKNIATGVNDPAEVAAANASFANLNTVVDGTVRSVGVQLKSGYAYEFAYSAVDYSAYQITQRYWVKVK